MLWQDAMYLSSDLIDRFISVNSPLNIIVLVYNDLASKHSDINFTIIYALFKLYVSLLTKSRVTLPKNIATL